MRQAEALAILQSGASVFLTGAPGAGKTYVLNEFVRHATTIWSHQARNSWLPANDMRKRDSIQMVSSPNHWYGGN